MSKRIYICIDLKSFYASVECRERGLDPLKTNLVVADPERTDKTICLAVTPAMKALGVPGRCRVFEIPKHIEYIMAPPRMQLYIDYAAEIYAVYLKFVAKEDIHVYSIDEVFIDLTNYLTMYQMTAKELAVTIMDDVYRQTGIIATCGIGTNLYLAKVALDITAKHVKDGIGILDEESYKKIKWYLFTDILSWIFRCCIYFKKILSNTHNGGIFLFHPTSYTNLKILPHRTIFNASAKR